MPTNLAIIYFLSASLSFVLGLLVLRQNSRNAVNRSFFLFTLSQALWVVSLYVGYAFFAAGQYGASAISIRLAYSFGFLMNMALSVFVYYFPKVTFQIPRSVKYGFWGIIIAMTISAGFTHWVHQAQVIENGVYVADKFGFLYPYYTLFSFLDFFLVSFIFAKKVSHLYGLERRKLLVSVIGTELFLILALTTNVVLPFFSIFTKIIIFRPQFSPVATFLFIGPAFYAIQKYRFLNIPNASLNLIRKLLVILFFLVFTILFISLGYFFFPKTSMLAVAIASSLMAFLATNQVRALLPDFITESFREFRDALNEFKARVSRCDTYGKLQRLVDEIFLVKLNFVTAKIYVVRKVEPKLKLPVYLRDSFTQELYSHSRDIVVREEIRYKRMSEDKKEAMVSVMERLEADLCVPLFSGKSLIGFLGVRKKEDHPFFSKEEIDELSKVKGPLEIGLMNILLTMDLVEENDMMRNVIHKKTQQLRERLQKIKTLSEQQSDFIAVTAHELRTPLNIAVFQTRELINHKSDPEAVAKGLQVVDSTLGNLTSLTQKLFDAQQFDFDKVRLHPVKMDIKKWIKAIHEECVLIMREKAVNFVLVDRLSRPLRISFDPSQLRQVLHNLVGNAYKFVPAGGLIELECEEAKGGVLIQVGDSGKGIPEALRLSVFDKFRSKGAKSGIGLGLYICKKIIQLHGGKIWVGDSSLGGALFSVFLKK